MSSDNILVAIKSRPLISRETSAQLRPQWAVHEKTIFQIDEEGHRLTEPYSFDHIFTEYITNANVYDAVVEPLVKSFLNGFNSTIFAYGQTSSGKTHTMMGTHDIPGIIQLAIGDVFHHVSNDNLRRYLISCSYFEIYNEKINDLLDKNGKDLKIREDFCGNTFVNAKEEVVTKAAHVYDLMKVGSKIRKIGCTNMNERSSRSHTIFRLTIKSTENNIENGPVQISYLNLVDLAGSERIAHTKAAGVRLKEGVNINKSLLALGNVIRQLSEGEGFINYRDSNLTRLLQHALGGNAKSLIIATITIAAGEETKSTLEFAQRAKVVKNKPVINEISEQDKLKQYELVTASYKSRLEKEKQRIQEMEREKEEREREILKLKRQVKLIDLFTNGPEVKTTESKIPRRHTMGHYPSRIPLQTIPESRVLPLNVIQEESVQNDTKCDLNDEESFLKRASQIDDYDYMNIILEEYLDDGIVSVTPEPSEELLIQEETTPTSQLRERLKHLEESYTSLQEFTKLETQFKEDKGIVLDLVKEKENLLKDLVDMNIIVRDTKRQKEEMKMKFEAEIITLKNDLKYVKKKSEEFSFALEQSEAEKDALRVAKEQLLNDNAVLLEQQKLKYEDQIEYFIKEIKELNKQGKEDQIAKNNFEEEIKRLRKENEDFKSTTEKMIIYEEKIMQLQEKLQKFESEEEEDFDILSKLYFLQDILLDDNIDVQGVSTQTEEITLEEKETVETELKFRIDETIIQKECEELKEKTKKLNDKLEDMQSLNLALQDELCECKEINSSLLEMKIANSNLKHEIAQKQEEIGILCTKIQNLEKEVPFKDDQIIDLKSKLLEVEMANSNLKNDISQKQKEIDILFTKVENLEKEVPLKDEQIMDLKSKLLEMEMANSNMKNDITQKQEEIDILFTKMQYLEKEVPVKDDQIIDLKSKLLEMEMANSNMKNDITQKQEEIDILFTKIQNVKKEGPFKDDQIIDLKSKLLEMETANSNMKNDISQKQDEIDILFTKIQNLEKEVPLKDDHIIDLKSKLLEMETANSNMKNDISQKQDEIDILHTKIQNLEKEVPLKDDRIIDLKSKLLEMETANNNMKNDISQKQDEINILFTKLQNLEKEVPLKDDHIIDLKSKLLEMEMANSNMKKDITQKQEEIDILFAKIQNLEKEMPIKDDQIKNLKSKLLEVTNSEAKNNITQEQEEIDILFTKIQNLEKEVILKDDQIIDLKSKLLEMANSNKNDIALKQEEIDILFTKMQNIEKEVLLKDDQIIDLKSELLEIDIAKSNMKNDIVIKQEEIDSLFSKIQNLEREISVKDLQIIDLKSKLLEIEIANSNMKNGIALKQEEVDILFMKIQNLEREILCKDDRIIDLKSKLDAIQIEQSENVADLVLYKDEFELKVNEITVLQNKLNELEKESENYKREIDIIKQQIMSKDKKIISLTEKCKVEASDKEALIQKIQHLEMKINKGKEKNEELENKIKNIYSDNITLRANIVDLEDVITDLKSNTLTKTVEPRSTRHSSASSSSLDLSPKELRKRKRQSIHDQRRGIDLAATAVAVCGDEESDTTEDDLKQKIKKLEDKIEFLSNENKFLESEVQGFISELDDCRMWGDERRNEIKMLKEQIEKMKSGQGEQDCNECRQKQHHIKKLEELKKQDMFKIVGLQTQIYDLENRYQEEKANIEERETRMNYEIKQLQTKLGETYELKDAEIQCELTNIEQLIEKYSKVKKLARMRREEGNILRARLGMNPDEPIM